MVNDEQLAKWEDILKSIPQAYPWESAVSILISEVRRLNTIVLQLEKEANWLALRVAIKYECLFVCPHGKSVTLEQCQQCFREQAREAIQDDK